MCTLRPALATDADFLRGLYHEARSAEARAWGLPEAAIPAFVAQQYAARTAGWAAAHPTAVDHIIEVAGEPVGRLLWVEASDHLHIIDIALAARCQGHSLGTQILTRLQARGQAIQLRVALDNPARRLYARLGFVGSTDDGIYALLRWQP